MDESSNATTNSVADEPYVQWEYHRVAMTLHHGYGDGDDELNILGFDGWELVGISNFTGVIGLEAHSPASCSDLFRGNPDMRHPVLIFKRRLTEERKQELIARQEKIEKQIEDLES